MREAGALEGKDLGWILAASRRQPLVLGQRATAWWVGCHSLEELSPEEVNDAVNGKHPSGGCVGFEGVWGDIQMPAV